MAEQVEIIDINLNDIITDGQEAGQTLKELKEQVKDLRKQLDDCTVGSDKFASTLDELTTAQEKLKKATKTSIDAVEGSYDSLVVKMGELKKAWRATADEAERSDLGAQIADINQQLKDMDASIGNYQRNVGDYASAFDNVTMKIEGGVAKFDRFNNVSRSVIGSFDLVEGGLKAIGVESEEVNDLMDKMQGAMMLTNGLNSVKEGVVAFNSMRVAVQGTTVAQYGLNAAMKANPLGAILAVITAVVTAVVALGAALNKAGDSSESLKEKNDELTESFEKQNEELDYNLRLMKAKGASELDVLRSEYQEKKRMADEYYQEYLKMSKEAKNSERWFGLADAVSDDEREELNKAYDKYLELHKEYTDAVKNYNVAVTAHNHKQEEEKKQAALDAYNAKRKAAKEAADAEIAEAERAKAAVSKSYNDLKREMEEYWLNDLQLRMKHLDEWVENEKAVVRDAREKEIISEEEKLEKIFELDRIYADKKKKLYEDAAEASEKYFEDTAATVTATLQTSTDATAEGVEEVTWATMEMKDKVQGVAGLMGTAFGQTAQLLNTLADQQDKTSKEGFEAAKKMSIGAAVMSMLQGIISSWTSAMSLPAPISFITGGIMSAFTATLGGIQIAQIKKQKFDGNDGGSGNTPQTPQINTAALLSSPVNYTTEIKGAKAVEDAQDTRVYVLESDITSTVDKVRVVEEESTY